MTDPKKRRIAVGYKRTELRVMNNAERRRVLNALCQDSVRKSERSSGSQSVPTRGAETQSGGSIQRNRSGSKDVRGDKKTNFNSQNKLSSTFEAIHTSEGV